jgi:hypothetical protein
LSEKKSSEIRLVPPRCVPLTAAEHGEAVALLADLLLDVAAKRGGVRSAGALDGASGGVIGGGLPFPERPGNARDAA